MIFDTYKSDLTDLQFVTQIYRLFREISTPTPSLFTEKNLNFSCPRLYCKLPFPIADHFDSFRGFLSSTLYLYLNWIYSGTISRYSVSKASAEAPLILLAPFSPPPSLVLYSLLSLLFLLFILALFLTQNKRHKISFYGVYGRRRLPLDRQWAKWRVSFAGSQDAQPFQRTPSLSVSLSVAPCRKSVTRVARTAGSR